MKSSSGAATHLTGLVAFALAGALALPAMSFAGGGFMGGQGNIVDEVSSDETEVPVDVETDGPLNDNMSSQGKLFGDLYKILRYQGSEESKLIPEVDNYGAPLLTDEDGVPDPIDGTQKLVSGPAPVGGEPVLSGGYGYYAKEVVVGEVVTYEVATSPYPSQCVQPLADYSKWGDIWGDPAKQNTLPLIITYDATWGRSECAVGQVIGEPTVNEDGTLNLNVDEYFIEPNGSWNGVVYCDGILWTDLIDEVSFGRLNLSRSPEAVLQASFDEAISSINNADIIEIDATGRLLLTTDIYAEFATAVDTGSVDPICVAEKIKTVTKAIDSPLENLALYVKLMQDGHLVTPGDERAPIDRSLNGGIPLWKMLELEDGPSTALRPTIDITKMREWGLDNLVDVTEGPCYTYFQCYKVDGTPADECLCQNDDGESVTCSDVDSRELIAVAECPDDTECDGPFIGIMTDDETITPAGADFDFAAAFLAAAADKTGDIGVDMVVYLNSILGINKVIGYSEYYVDGNPTADAINYAKNPVYFNYGEAEGVSEYLRGNVFTKRGQVQTRGGEGDPSIYDGKVKVLLESTTNPGNWAETPLPIIDNVTFDNIGLSTTNGFPDGVNPAADDILGFSQMADDDLSVIEFIHTYQIPGLR